MTPDNKIMSFSEFINSLQSAKHEHFLAREEVGISDETEFTRMKSYLVQHYEGVEALNSFVDENGSIFDCVPIEKQPSVRRNGQSVAKPPDFPVKETKNALDEHRYSTAVSSPLNANLKDRFGNALNCPPNTVPIRRITLDDMTRFGSLENFFQKGGVRPYRTPNTMRSIIAEVPMKYFHHHAIAEQQVDNLGGHSSLNVWTPPIDEQLGQVFSLSQQWYVGLGPPLQTFEVGWQVYPNLYNGLNPVLFVGYTADAYRNFCYNQSCTSFVVTGNKSLLGGAIVPSSIQGGIQKSLEVSVLLHQGNWWVYVGGFEVSNILGYLPTSAYAGGPMASCANKIQYGGETCVANRETNYPNMGSGLFANAGWQNAAYQKDIYYISLNGQTTDPSLTTLVNSQCYTSIVARSDDPNWADTVWFGGPGGDCPGGMS
jgi:hypothetical protein